MEKITHLVSSKEFGKTLKSVSDSEYRCLRDNYDAFLDMPLELWQFVPVGDNNKVLEEPKMPHWGSENQDEYMAHYNLKLAAYNKAKERCIFEGFKPCIINRTQSATDDTHSIFSDLQERNTIESISHMRPPLTQSALKQIY